VARWWALVALAVLLWIVREALPPFVIAAVLAYILSPLADEVATRLRIRRSLAALGVFAAVLVMLLVVGFVVDVRLTAEMRDLSSQGPNGLETAVDQFTGGQAIQAFGQEVTARELARFIEGTVRNELGTPRQAFQALRLGLDLTFAVILTLLSLAYMLVDGDRLWRYVLRFVPVEYRGRVETLSAEIHRVLGRYLRGQLILIVLMATVTFVVLEWVFHLPYALWIAILTGFLEVIPLIGPVTAGAIACLVGLAQGGVGEAAALAVTYLILRQTEDQLIMPQVVGRAVHVHPLVTIFAVLAGERIAGVLGMVLAVPTAAAIKVVLDYAYPRPAAESERVGVEVKGREVDGQVQAREGEGRGVEPEAEPYPGPLAPTPLGDSAPVAPR
jgi:predicted PurR-regulated permease PerM